LQSRPFDSECVKTERLALVDGGYLRHWLLTVRSAARLRLRPNGCAVGVGDPHPSADNAYIAAGKHDPADMRKSVSRGIYITDSFGGGLDPVTGDFSRGASGLLIENGEFAGAVNEFTVGGNMKDLFARLLVGNDLAFDYGRNSPTLMAPGLAVAGA